jgi:hypothetical protein
LRDRKIAMPHRRLFAYSDKDTLKKMHLFLFTFILGFVLPCLASGQGAPKTPADPGSGGVGTAGPRKVQILKDLPQATSEELAAHPPIPHPGDGLTDQERTAQEKLVGIRQGSPNGVGGNAAPLQAGHDVRSRKLAVPQIKKKE